jgi:putative glycerol-1-phosphate prenyltransferase
VIFNELEKKRGESGTQILALIDPDSKNDPILSQIVRIINKSSYDGILVGGSSISDNNFEDRLKIIRDETDLPIIIFPGDSSQVSKIADGILFLSLLSGRNPKYLIEEQVASSKNIYNYKLEVIPTGYLLLKTNRKTTVEVVSDTDPLDMDDSENIISHALAAQYLGNKLLFLECGSNSNSTINTNLLNKISKFITIPIMVGGGIKDKTTAIKLANNGASYLVIGSLIEETLDYKLLLDINQSIRRLNGNK